MSTRSLIASTLRLHEPDVADSVTKDFIIMRLLGDKDIAHKLYKAREVKGNYAEGLNLRDDPGRNIVYKVRKGRNTTVKAYSGFDVLDTTPQDNFDEVEFDWKSVSGSVNLSEEDLDKNSGSKTKIFDLLEASIDDLKISLQEKIADYLLGSVPNTVEGRKQPTGLLDMIQDDPTSLPTAGVNIIGKNFDTSDAANEFWRNQKKDQGAVAFGTDEAGVGHANLRQLIRDCTFGASQRPSVLLAGEDAYEAVEKSMLSQKRIVDAKSMMLQDAGLQAISVHNIPMVMEKQIDVVRAAAALDGSAIYAINLNFWKIEGMARKWFKMTDFRRPTNQDSRVAHCIVRLQQTTKARRTHGVLFNVV
jgi:hypothetical protein